MLVLLPQPKIIKQVAGQLKLLLAQYTELQAFTTFASDLDSDTQRQLRRGNTIREFLKQAPGQPHSVLQQVALIYTGTRTSACDAIQLDKLADVKHVILKRMGEARWMSMDLSRH